MLKFEDIAPGLIVRPQSDANEKLFRGDGESINYYAVVTDFYVNGLWGQYPRMNEDRVDLLRAFETATQDRSINGYGGVMVSGDQITPLNSRYLFPLVNELSNRIGWVAMFPYVSDTAQRSKTALPDAIRVIIAQDDRPIGIVRDYSYSGSTLGPRRTEMAVPLVLATFGNGISDYTNMKFLVDEINNRVSKNKIVLDRHSNPHIQGPNSATPRPQEDDQGNVTQMGFQFNEGGMFLPRDNEEGGYEYLSWDAKSELGRLQMDRIIDLLHVVTGVPASAFGLRPVGNTSGTSLERQMFAAISKVRRWRRDIQQAAMLLGVEELDWVEDPFADFQERATIEIQLVSSGIVSVEEARRRLGI